MRKYIVLLMLLVSASIGFGQQAWKVGGNILGTNVLMTGKLSVALADSATFDTTNAANAIYSATLSNSVYLISGKTGARFGYVVIDTAIGGTGTPTGILALQGSLNGTVWKTVVDTISSGKRFFAVGTRTGAFVLGTANLTSVKFPYFRLKYTPSATLGAASTGVGSALWKPGRLRWVIIP